MSVKLPSFQSARVLVIGDVMLDQYWNGDASRLSPEAPVPIVKVDHTHTAPGGAGNVALNLASLGVQTTLCGVVGDDAAADDLITLLKNSCIDCQLSRVPSYPTVHKLRVLGQNQQLIRADFEKDCPESYFQALCEVVLGQIKQFDVVLISDYGKGIQQIVPQVIEQARQDKVEVLVDPKSSDFACYENASLITPNRAEFEAVVGPCYDQAALESQALALIKQVNLGGLLVTQGAWGMTLVKQGEPPLHMPTKAQEVYDVTGAGDTVIAVMAAVIASGESWAEAARLANVGAGQVVAHLGTVPINLTDLRQGLHESQEAHYGIMELDSLAGAVTEARARGETVVMTNGCFDLLHQGHIQYLEQAKQLGDRLVVAVNDDESVRKLKGPDRPLKPITERMTILSALRAVDWVVCFSEDTPAQLIEQLSPDILVKGGDYQTQDIAGAQHVMANGGEVRVLHYYEGYSTSSMIQTIQELDV